jgi:hypothetical protein
MRNLIHSLIVIALGLGLSGCYAHDRAERREVRAERHEERGERAREVREERREDRRPDVIEIRP